MNCCYGSRVLTNPAHVLGEPLQTGKLTLKKKCITGEPATKVCFRCSAIELRLPFGPAGFEPATHGLRSNSDLHHRRKNQSGNNHQEHASGRTVCRCFSFRGYASAATGFSEPGRVPKLCAARRLSEYLLHSATDWKFEVREQ